MVDLNAVDNYTMECKKFISQWARFIKYIDELYSKPSVVCIQEYWLKPQLKFILQEYNVIHRDMELEVGQQLL